MAVDQDMVRTPIGVAVTLFLALAISVHFIKRFFIDAKRTKKSCYLHTEPKPQHNFKKVLAENSYSQFKHLKLQTPDANSDEDYSNLHPYREEISKLLKSPNVGFLEFLGEYYNDIDALEMRGSCVWVETEAQLRELVALLSNEKIFAVDTEQHSFRSFLGFTALIQISTILEDFLVDAIKLHDAIGLLRPVFANPEICKVFHGADNDVLWLQRDFHIYVVNLFDTAKVCDVVSKPQRSLAYLLETYCGVTTNKLLQREDWRRRPLPEEMIQYARMDAHYLLYVAHCLCLELSRHRNENSSPGDKFHFLHEASRRSNATCLQLFVKEVETFPGELAASSIISRCLNYQTNIPPNYCDSKFQELVRRFCLWRDIMARIHDESLRYVLSENAIIALAANIHNIEVDICNVISKADVDVEPMPLTPLQSPSSVVSSHLDDIFYLSREDKTNLDNIFELFIRQHLSAHGSCPLSVYNYGLLSRTSLRLTNRSIPNYNGFRASKRVSKKASRELFVQKFSCKSQVYHNCKIYANDGRLLCYCDRRKLEWYINRNLAKLVDKDPPSIMLLFEPKGRPEDEDNDFYIQSKKNICVGCGEGNHYLRYRIIPSCYRMHFPEHLKSHRSHDIVLVCVDCHEIAHAAAEKYKKQVAAEYGIPLFIRKVVDFDKTQIAASPWPNIISEEFGVSPLQLRTAAMALLRHGPQMPSERREELMLIVTKYYGGREISDEDLERALLVGMTPHERKRFEKKRGYAFKHLTDGEINNIGGKKTLKLLDGKTTRILGANLIETDQNQSDVNCLMDEDTGGVPQQIFGGNTGDTSRTGSLLLGETGTVYAAEIPSKHESKLSLLGHGPHGKKVVEYLLEQYGEDGIREFCQRWRQVFVEALHPRFLPGGWDVKHSGKRDFGEFSVYNPANRFSGIADTVLENPVTNLRKVD